MNQDNTNAESIAESKASAISAAAVIRLVAASIIFAVSLIVRLPDFAKIIMLAGSAIIAGYDIAVNAINFAAEGDFFSTPLVVTVVAFISFFIGFGVEGAALTILYQIGILMIVYVEERTKKTAIDGLKYESEETVAGIQVLLEDDEATKTNIENSMGYNASSVLKLAMLIAVLYAALMPLFTNMTYSVSIHRGLIMLLVSTPMSVVVSIHSICVVGICYAAQLGVSYKNAHVFEQVEKTTVAIVDKSGVIDGGNITAAVVPADLIDSKTFMNFAAHALYYSEQPVAKAIASLYKDEYRLELISNFSDIPGNGVDVSIGDLHVTVGSRELFAKRGEAVPYEKNDSHQIYYMMISDKYAGKIILSDDINEEAEDFVAGLKEMGFTRLILITEDNKESTSKLADDLGFDEAYSGFDTEKKLQFVQHIKEGINEQMVYVYSSGIDCHSKADVDIRVSNKSKFADILVNRSFVTNLPAAIHISSRVREIAVENAVFAFLIKAVLIFLSITGYCNIWFAIFIDMTAAVLTVLNSYRVTKDSLIGLFLYKSGH